MSKPVCVITGVGPGNGAAFAKKFASKGYAVALLARNASHVEPLAAQLADANAYTCDVTQADAVETVFSQIRHELGLISVLIYNAGSGHFKNIDETTPAMFETDWRVNALGCLLISQQVLPDMRQLGGGNIVVIGATASLKGNAGFAPFAAAKSAQRSLAQSMARHLGPEHIHVAYVIVDGVVDLNRTRQAMPDKPDDFFINPGHIAESVWHLVMQKPSAWTFELDLRPFAEKW